MQRGRDARGAAAPVVAGDGKSIELQRVGKVDEVLADCRLLGHPRSVRVTKARLPVSAQVGHQHAMSGFRQRRRDLVVRVDVIRKPVKEDDREA